MSLKIEQRPVPAPQPPMTFQADMQVAWASMNERIRSVQQICAQASQKNDSLEKALLVAKGACKELELALQQANQDRSTDRELLQGRIVDLQDQLTLLGRERDRFKRQIEIARRIDVITNRRSAENYNQVVFVAAAFYSLGVVLKRQLLGVNDPKKRQEIEELGVLYVLRDHPEMTQRQAAYHYLLSQGMTPARAHSAEVQRYLQKYPDELI